MSIDPEMLRRSFALVVERAPDVTGRFYDLLFARHPALRGMFSRNARAKQEEMLARAIGAVLDHLEAPGWLASNLAALGARHAGYGVRPEMYSWVGDALLSTLAEIAGDDWTQALAAQWTEAYGVVVTLMRSGEAVPVEVHDSSRPHAAPM